MPGLSVRRILANRRSAGPWWARGLGPQDVDALFVVSVTGIASPSLDARLVNRMGMSPRIKRIPIFGLGCVAGAAGIARAADYVRAFPHHVAALLSVELCSLTLQKEDVSMANLISSALFGDGAAAVVVAGAERDYPGAEILDTRSVFYPQTEHIMGWDISEKGFQIVLSPTLPQLIVDHLGHDVDAFLADHGLGPQGHRPMDSAHGRPQNSRGNGHGARVVERGNGGLVGVPAQSGQSFLRLRAPGAGGSFQTAAPGSRDVLPACRHGTGFLFGIGSSQVELMGSDVLKTDVFIVGGGPAGLATAIAIRQRGLRVVVADLARPPIDKACGEGLMPQTVAELKGLGVTLGPVAGHPLSRHSLHR